MFESNCSNLSLDTIVVQHLEPSYLIVAQQWVSTMRQIVLQYVYPNSRYHIKLLIAQG